MENQILDYKLVFTLTIPALVTILGWFIVNRINAKRDKQTKKREKVVEYLIASYRILTYAPHRDPLENPQSFLRLEEAIADIQLFGTQKQVRLAKQVSDSFATDKTVDLQELIILLRNDLRKELGLEDLHGEGIKHLRMKLNFESEEIKKINDALFLRVGMALLSAQRVEFVTSQILEHLKEFDEEVYKITSVEFLNDKRHSKARKTLGDVFILLKLNSKLVIEEQLNEYLKRRNILAHDFWKNYLTPCSEEQAKRAVDFCNDFGRLSVKLESFFKGFLYFLALRHVPDRSHLKGEVKTMENDLEYFMEALKQKNL